MAHNADSRAIPQPNSGAAARWRSQAESHHAQSMAAQRRTGWTEEDRWVGLAANYEADPSRTNDPILNRLIQHLSPGATVVDVGGGAGRYALPLAFRGHQVTVVEPSTAMGEVLLRGTARHGLENVALVPSSLENADLAQADVVLCAHVVYGVTEIAPFLAKLGSLARTRVLVLLYFHSPMAIFSPIWERVHGEKRIELPALRELMEVLWEMGIYPDLEMLALPRPESARTLEEMTERLRQFLYLKRDDEANGRLREAIAELVVRTDDGFVLPGAEKRRPGLVTWRTD